MPSNAERPVRARTGKRHLALGLVLLAAGSAVCGVDRRLKTSETAGFVLPAADWRLEATNLPGCWTRWRDLDPYGAFQKSAPSSLQAVSVAVRKLSGVRPTPQRLRLWLGNHFLIGGDEDGWCLSARPGVALRAASLFLPAAPDVEARDGQPFWASCAYGWRDGFFLLASSRGYLERVIAEGQPVPRSADPGDTIAISWAGNVPGFCRVSAKDQLPVTFSLERITPAADATLVHADGWPDALCWVAFHDGSTAQALTDMGTALARRVTGDTYWPAVESVWKLWRAAYRPFTFSPQPGAERALGVFEADFHADIPAVESVWAEQGDGGATLANLAAAAPRRDHRWNETEGWLFPLPGEARAWAAAYHGGALYVASGESLMPAVLAADTQTPETGVAALAIRWKPFAQALKGLVRRAATDELLPGLNEDDVSADVLPNLEALEDWGMLQLHLKGDGGGLSGGGFLALAVDAP